MPAQTLKEDRFHSTMTVACLKVAQSSSDRPYRPMQPDRVPCPDRRASALRMESGQKATENTRKRRNRAYNVISHKANADRCQPLPVRARQSVGGPAGEPRRGTDPAAVHGGTDACASRFDVAFAHSGIHNYRMLQALRSCGPGPLRGCPVRCPRPVRSIPSGPGRRIGANGRSPLSRCNCE